MSITAIPMHLQEVPTTDGTGTAAPHHNPEATGRGDVSFTERRAVLLHGLRALLQQYPIGETLPSVRELATQLGQAQRYVGSAMVHLDRLGEVVYSPSGGRNAGRRRLSPQEQHPNDITFDRAVRDGIESGRHEAGTVLPTAILAVQHGLTLELVPRALRLVIKDRLVAFWEGPHGPGYYVLPVSGRPA
ncbi:hypothetical protein [Streptomyces sp. NPDC056891]|uniref:hypothetical protein n=1 Tax=unclassified Streptomyces TaxID=2593676 RepID=UPI0036BECEDC